MPWTVHTLFTECIVATPTNVPPAAPCRWRWWQYAPSSTRPQLVIWCHFIETRAPACAMVEMPWKPYAPWLALHGLAASHGVYRVRAYAGPVIRIDRSKCITSACSRTGVPFASLTNRLVPRCVVSRLALSSTKQGSTSVPGRTRWIVRVGA